MTWEIVLALVLAIPVILLPVAYIGYLTIGGVAAVRGERKERAGAAGHAVAGENQGLYGKEVLKIKSTGNTYAER